VKTRLSHGVKFRPTKKAAGWRRHRASERDPLPPPGYCSGWARPEAKPWSRPGSGSHRTSSFCMASRRRARGWGWSREGGGGLCFPGALGGRGGEGDWPGRGRASGGRGAGGESDRGRHGLGCGHRAPTGVHLAVGKHGRESTWFPLCCPLFKLICCTAELRRLCAESRPLLGASARSSVE